MSLLQSLGAGFATGMQSFGVLVFCLATAVIAMLADY